jgi:hypothetical protein
MNTEGIEVRSVGNTLTLHETALIESFNLQAAIEYQHKHSKLVLLKFPIMLFLKIFNVAQLAL